MKGSRSNYVSGFDPTTIPGCALWLDAADRSSLTLSGSNVTQWRDKSGQGNTAVSFLSSPTFSNGAVHFNGSQGLSNGLTASSTVESGFVVVTFSNVGTANTLLGSGNSNSGRQFRGPGVLDTLVQETSLVLSAGAVAINTPYLAEFVNNGSTLTHYLTGTLTGSAASVGYTAGRTTSIGARFPVAFAEGLVGSIREILVYSVAVSTAQRQQIEGYLAAKWGLQARLPRAAFTPLDISGCQIWLDAADPSGTGVLPANNSTITTWVDKSGAGLNATTIEGSPTYQFTNGYSRVTFSNSFMTTPTIPASRLDSTGVTYIAVATTTSSANQQLAFGSATPEKIIRYDVLSSLYTINNGTQRSLTNNFVNGIRLFTDTASQFNAFVNGTNSASSSTAVTYQPQTTSTFFQLGKWNTNYFTGFIQEVLAYNTALTTTQRQQVESYLARKWGISSSLPSIPDHPYKTFPPTLRPFAPIDISGCALWLDAADATTLTLSGSNVTQWNDKSGNGRNTTSVTGTVTFSNSGLSITTASSYLTGSLGASDYTGSTITCFVVASMNSTSGAFARFLSLGKVGTADWNNLASFSAFNRGGSGLLLDCARNGLGTNGPPSIPNYATRFLATSGQTSSLFFVGVNGGAASERLVSGAFAMNAYRIGQMMVPGTDEQLNGTIHEVLIYFTELTATQRQQVEGYLARKWGLQSNLPAIALATPGFSPLDVSGCQLWLDASDSSTLTLSGSNVTQWNDKSGNGRNATIYSNAPTFSNAAVRFTSAGNQGLQTSLSASTNVESALIVAGATQNTAANTLLGSANGEGGRQFRIPGQIQTIKQNIVGVLFSGPTLPTNTTHLVEFTNNGSTLTHYWNGSFYASGSALSYDANRTTSIGRRFTAEGFDGYIHEILVYNSALTTSQRQQLELYLANKWGVRLTYAHPYAFGLPALTAGFTPVAIPGCSLWIDAADSNAYQLSGSNITRVIDKSSIPTTFSNATGFTLSRTFNGRYPSFYNPTLLANSTLGVNSSYSISQPFTIFCVAQRTAAVNGTAGFLFDQTPGSSNRIYIWDPFPSCIYVTTTAQTTVPSSVAAVISTEISSASYFYQNGTQAAVTSNNPVVNQSGLTLGNSRELTGSWGGHICEMLFYSGSLTTSQRQQVEGYLAWKWGLQGSLPGAHPYRLIKP